MIEKFFDDLELQCALGEDRPAPRIAQAPPKNTGGEWDIWFSPEAADCPAEGGGCKEVSGKAIQSSVTRLVQSRRGGGLRRFLLARPVL